MTACTMDSLVARTRKKIMGEQGLAMLRALRDLSALAALCVMVNRATRLENYERVGEVAHQLMDDPRIRGRLRQAYFGLNE